MKSMRGLQPPRPEQRQSDGEVAGSGAPTTEPTIVEAPRWTPAEKLSHRPLFFC